MLIGQRLGLDFADYALEAAVPVLAGLLITWAVLAWQWRGRWMAPAATVEAPAPVFSAWQTCKGVAVLCVLVAAFLFTGVPREVSALTAAGLLLLSRRMYTRDMLGLVDWHLLVLFGGLFVVHGALEHSGLAAGALAALRAGGVDLAHPPVLFSVTVVLSNLVSNVPATMLLLPAVEGPMAGNILALASTFAGNLILVGSIANIIVADQAQRVGIRIGWAAHARVGVPVTLASLAVAALWLWGRHG
jgi:Na+/H+ antiporter NhaD/arsenite permease-like protein